MNTKMLPVIVSLVVLCSCTKTTKTNYLFLNASQLKPLGIEINDKGVFYKNENPNWKQDKEKYACMAFYCSKYEYVSSKQFNPTDTLKALNLNDSIIARKELTKYDFYPLLIGDTNGHQSLDRDTLPQGLKLIPIAICMAKTNLSTRKDTIVVWLKATESLKRALPSTIIMDDYLTTRPVKI